MGWRVLGTGLFDDGETASWAMLGTGGPGQVLGEVYCVPRSTGVEIVERQEEMAEGGQCRDIRCAPGQVILNAQAVWDEALDPDQLRPSNASSWVFCAFNPGPEPAMATTQAVCVPEP